MAENGITDAELERAVNWKKSCIAYSSETNADLAEINCTYAHLYNVTMSLEDRAKLYDNITTEKVNAFAKRIASETVFNVVAVGKNIKIEDIKVYKN